MLTQCSFHDARNMLPVAEIIFDISATGTLSECTYAGREYTHGIALQSKRKT